MKGLEKLINDLAKVTCPSENDLYQEVTPCPYFMSDEWDDSVCVDCWKKALEHDVPEIK